MSSSPIPDPPPRPTSAHAWVIERSSGDAGPFHDRPLPTEPTHQIWIHEVARPALVLGSTQSEHDVNTDLARRDGIEVCRRRSGGGIVALSPGADCWIDVIVPRHSPLWHDDIGVSFDWLGRLWARTISAALAEQDPTPPPPAVEVYRGPLRGGPAGRLVCFASLGPGEVTVDGRKVVGISQRRTRDGARFQSVATGRWDADSLDRYVSAERLRSVDLRPSAMLAGSTGAWPTGDDLAERFCALLPDLEGRASDSGGTGR